MTTPKEVDGLAAICHDANRRYCICIGDTSQPTWEDTPEDIKETARSGVRAILEDPNTTSRELHDLWKENKIKDGWVYGETKDADKKTHPCIVGDYSELPTQQRFKDDLFISIVRMHHLFCKGIHD